MSFEIQGRVIKIQDAKRGVSKTGNEWQSQEFAIETEAQYPKKVNFKASGKTLQYVDNLKIGDLVTVSFEPESREYNGNFYTELKAYKIVK